MSPFAFPAHPFAPPSATSPRPPRDHAIEGLRGAAALTVLCAHLCRPDTVLDSAYAPPAFLDYLNAAHAAVLVFFALSGYVIGLSVQGTANADSLRAYARRRFCRLVPINTLAVGLGLLFGPGAEWRAGLLNLFFLQNSAGYAGLSAPLLRANPNLWSLHYEVVCYAAFVAVWFFQPRAWLVFAACLASALGLGFAPGLDFAAHWALGLVFWFSGLALAWNRADSFACSSCSTWPAALFAIVGTRHLEPLVSPFARLGLDRIDHTAIVAADLAYLAPVVWLLAAISGASLRLQRMLALATCAPLLALCLWRTARGHPPSDAHDWIGFIAVAGAVLLSRRSFGHSLFRRLAPVGLLSYALYALAGPFQHLLAGRSLLSGSPTTWLLRGVLVVSISFLVAWLVERGLARRSTKRRAFASAAPEPA